MKSMNNTGEFEMTSHRAVTARRIAALVALTVSMATLSTSASFAFSPEAQEMCTGDAFRLCSSEIPNIGKITACMRKQRANLSVGCRQVMDRDDAAASKPAKVATR
jgi:hypothetical protein